MKEANPRTKGMKNSIKRNFNMAYFAYFKTAVIALATSLPSTRLTTRPTA